jgi:hypothetical protein
MFINTISLADDNASASLMQLPLVDGPTNHKTLRSVVSGGSTYDFTIGHQPSNENPGFDTQRTVVRLSRLTRDSESGKDHTAYCQLILSFAPSMRTVDEVNELVAYLISFLLTQGDAGNFATLPAPPDTVRATTLTTVTRLYSQEP